MGTVADSSVRFKPVRSRRLRGGAWVIVASGSEPLIVPDEIEHALASGATSTRPDFVALCDVMSEAGFVVSGRDGAMTPLPSPPDTPAWTVARWALWMIGLIMAVAAAILLVKNGIPTGADVISAEAHPMVVVVLAITIAAVTSVPHELAHVLFGKTFRQHRGSVRLDPRRAAATTSLTHVWTWPLSSRLAAVSAGLVVDLCFLVVALATRETTGSWVATVGVAILLMRIVWQLRVHRNCDGRHIAKMLIDNPMIEVETQQAIKLRQAATPVTWLWGGLVALGIVAELSLLVVWIGPAVLRVVGAV